jgi:O-antigen ligase
MTFLKLKKINFSLILLSLLPVAFVIGPLIVEIFINILILIFLYNCVKNNNFYFFKNRIFIFFFLFYLFLIINLLFSDFFLESALNVFSYIRFILFPFAIFEILQKNKKNLKFVFLILLVTIFVVVLDGYYQFTFDKNFFGYEKYRVDRISGFFDDDLILGSYLSRLLPLFIALIIFFKNDKKLSLISLLVFFITYILIFLTGERASFLMASLALLIIVIQIRVFFYPKIVILIASVSVVILFIFFNPIMFDRHFSQYKNQIVSQSQSSKNIILPYYMPMFKTSLKMFNDNKLFGHGPKSYRYSCHKEKFITYFPGSKKVDNTRIRLPEIWKKKDSMVILKFFVREGDIIEKGDKILTFKYSGDDDLTVLFSNKEGKIDKIINKIRYISGDIVMQITPQYSPKTVLLKINACNTHPHNFYIQLLAETGLIGFIFIFGLFIYLLYLLVIKKKTFSDSEICILVGFFITLWPLTTNGNFFNNWINLISFYPLGFLLYMLSIKNKER